MSQMKYLILLVLIGCAKPEVKPEPKPIPTPPVVVEKKCVVESDKYSPVFKELICALRDSEKNPNLKSIVLAQWILETGRGKSSLARNHYNFGGLKWRKEMAVMARPVSYEAHDGKTEYVKFSSAENFIEGYWHFINRKIIS